MIEAVHVGGMVTVQDLGRAGFGRWGVSPSGAADRSSHRLAARLVGNAEGAAGLELTLGTLTLVARQRHVVAVTGAAVPVLLDARPAPMMRPLLLDSGSELRIGMPTHG